MAGVYPSTSAIVTYPDSIIAEDNKAHKYNEKLIKGWTKTVKTTLIVAAIYTVFLTLFVVKSMDLLRPDMVGLILDTTIFMVRSGTSTPSPRFNPASYPPGSSSLTITSLLFSALSIAVVTTLTGVVLLHYVASYDRSLLYTGNFMDDTLQRNINAFVVALPILLLCSAAISLAGIFHWLWMLSGLVAKVVMGSVFGSFGFYLLVTLILSRVLAGPMGQKKGI